MQSLELHRKLSTKQCRNFCCVKDNQGKLRLKRNHKYYYQIQTQLALCELKFCDFVVWSPKGMSVERIFVNNDLWSYMYPQLEAFHREYLVPEYFLMRLPRELEIVQLKY